MGAEDVAGEVDEAVSGAVAVPVVLPLQSIPFVVTGFSAGSFHFNRVFREFRHRTLSFTKMEQFERLAAADGVLVRDSGTQNRLRMAALTPSIVSFAT